jgi:predicted GNAT family acetyltransferase
MAHVEIRHNSQRHRYEAWRDGTRVGHTMYRLTDGTIVFVHTEVDQQYRGEGIGSTLIQAALDDVRDTSTRRVVAQCPMVRTWLHRHPDYQDLQRRPTVAAERG